MNKNYVITVFLLLVSVLVNAANEIKLGDVAPDFTIKTHENKDFDLKSRKGSWTVLYFYPKAGTPGCTTQACAFRDSIQKIRDQGADVFGISSDSVQDQVKFHKQHKLNFILLADVDSKIANMYGSKMPLLSMSKRWTFILDPDLKIRQIDKDVDPVLDAEHVAKSIEKLKSSAK